MQKWLVPLAGIIAIMLITLYGIYQKVALTDLTVPLGAITGLASYHLSKQSTATTPPAVPKG